MTEDGQGLEPEHEELTGQHSDKRGEHCSPGQLRDHYKGTCLTPRSHKKQLASNRGRPTTSKAYSPFRSPTSKVYLSPPIASLTWTPTAPPQRWIQVRL